MNHDEELPEGTHQILTVGELAKGNVHLIEPEPAPYVPIRQYTPTPGVRVIQPTMAERIRRISRRPEGGSSLEDNNPEPRDLNTMQKKATELFALLMAAVTALIQAEQGDTATITEKNAEIADLTDQLTKAHATIDSGISAEDQQTITDGLQNLITAATNATPAKPAAPVEVDPNAPPAAQ